MPRSVPALLLVVLIAVPSAHGQWSVGLELGADRVWQFADPIDPDQTGLRVRPTMTWPLTVRLARGGPGLQVALAASRVGAGLELDDGSLAVAVRPAFRVLTLAPEVSGPVLPLRGGGALRAVASMPLERWSYVGVDETPRWRLGAAVGLAAEVPVRESVSLRIAAQVGRLFGNPISDTEMTQEYTPATLWRRALRLGIAWRIG